MSRTSHALGLLLLGAASALSLALAGLAGSAGAQTLTFPNRPLYLGSAVPPIAMIDLTKDHALHRKAYNDYSDLDKDGKLELTYKHAIDYYGYFDSKKCYKYVHANRRFEPQVIAGADKYCTAGSNHWSGNFLNWVAMTRIDAVRKILYGGMRSATRTADDGFAVSDGDTATSTVLERSFLPNDAHSWVKHYSGTDLSQLTPFTDPQTPTTSTSLVNLQGFPVSKVFTMRTTAAVTTFSNAIAVGHTVRFSNGTNSITGVVVDKVGTPATITLSLPAATAFAGSGTFSTWLATNVTLNTNVGNASSTSNTINADFPIEKSFVVADTAGITTTGSTSILELYDPASPDTRFAKGTVVAVNSTSKVVTLRIPSDAHISGTGATNSWNVRFAQAGGVSFCNTTLGTTTSQENVNMPRLRIAKGNYSLWAANERWQCRWDPEKTASNANNFAASGIAAFGSNPVIGTAGLTVDGSQGDVFVRAQVCVNNLLGTEKCKQYPDGNFKPIGLLQEYGDDDRIRFGLMTGSYDKNLSGGVLRKNAEPMSTVVSSSLATAEVNALTNGTFRSAPVNGGIINTIDRLKIHGYLFSNGTYGDLCSFGLTSITQGECESWGNPIGEVYLESLRYLAGKAPLASFLPPTGSGKDFNLGLKKASWNNPLTAANYCAPLNVMVFNAAVSTNEEDLNTLSTGANFPGNAASAVTPAKMTKLIGDAEFITNSSFFVGRTGTLTNELCDGKSVTNLGEVLGICPEGPTVGGGFNIGGLAHWARTNRIRTDLSVPASNLDALKVNTYGIQLATNSPSITLQIPDDPSKRVVLLPSMRLAASGGTFGGGALVDFRIIKSYSDSNGSEGVAYVNWEDSEQGGDYDQDMWGTLKWKLEKISGVWSVKVTTDVINDSTGYNLGFGYVISGTTKDGPHFHSGINSFSFNDPTGVTGCAAGACTSGAAPTSVTYAVGTSSAQSLRDPLWYAAKYGGFKEPATSPTRDGVLNSVTEWDSDGDGVPDSYYLVTNPLGLEESLDKAFSAILQSASSASVATNSTQLKTNTAVFQAKFNPGDWSGQLLAFSLDSFGSIVQPAKWDASQLIPAPASRVVLTYNPSATPGEGNGAQRGVAFRWNTLPTDYQAFLATDGTTPDGLGAACTSTVPSAVPVGCTNLAELRLNWIRGDRSAEGRSGKALRVRGNSVLGDLAGSNPLFVDRPIEDATKAPFNVGDYAGFLADNLTRAPMVYVGGNDGMLHGFDATPNGATAGVEKLAYIPGHIYPNLTKQTSRAYSHAYTVDGSPVAKDVCKDSCASKDDWSTVLVGGYRSGGKGLYALDITKPDTFSESTTSAHSTVLWEFSNLNDPDFGYSFSKPVIAKMQNNRWAVIVGNGYNSTTLMPHEASTSSAKSSDGKAALFILFITGGTDGKWTKDTDYIKLSVPGGSVASPNGLATPKVVLDSDGKVKTVYAGDLLGNMWRFDVSSSTVTSWVTPTAPLFVARDADGNTQPITTSPEVVASTKAGGGHMVMFGTGKFIESVDSNGPHSVQSMYGIFDNGTDNVTGRPVLMEQIILTATSTNPSGATVDDTTTPAVNEADNRIFSAFEVNYTSSERTNTEYGDPNTNPNAKAPTEKTPAQKGWYIDFPYSGDGKTGSGYPASAISPGTGEKVGFDPLLTPGGNFQINSVVPSVVACDRGGVSWTMTVDPENGGRLAASSYDIDGDGVPSLGDFIKMTVGGVTYYVAANGTVNRNGVVPTSTLIVLNTVNVNLTVPGPGGFTLTGVTTVSQQIQSSSDGQVTGRKFFDPPRKSPPPSGTPRSGRRVSWRELITD